MDFTPFPVLIGFIHFKYILNVNKTYLLLYNSLDGITANCDLEDYPANIRPAVLTYNSGEVLACGGNDPEDADRCWRFNGSAWSPLPNFNQ